MVVGLVGKENVPSNGERAREEEGPLLPFFPFAWHHIRQQPQIGKGREEEGPTRDPWTDRPGFPAYYPQKKREEKIDKKSFRSVEREGRRRPLIS